MVSKEIIGLQEDLIFCTTDQKLNLHQVNTNANKEKSHFNIVKQYP
jgi:hypothetical protein